GYRRFLGALDELAGKLLDDDEIAQRGQDLRRETGADPADDPARTEAPDAGAEGEAGVQEAGVTDEAGAPQGPAAGDTAADESVWSQASGDADRTGEAGVGEAGVGEAWAAGNARVAAEAEGGEAGESGEPPSTRTVDVVFSLPAGTAADRVTLCGEFNDWSPEATSLTRGDDRAWRVTVPLAPGSYRYKFLLDGQTWENGTDADRLEENAYGTVDSVIVVAE
ncbi:MAG TPA: isoamylase early set domain-containing protein, partial [Streptosporangiaceae bacterium]